MQDNNKFIDELKRVHNGSWGTFFSIYNFQKSLSKSLSFKISIVLSVIIQVFISFSTFDFIKLLENIISRNLSIIPNLLGFAIGGYALLISGYSENLLRRIVKTKFKEGEITLPYNSFQKTSSVFGMAIFTMAISLMLNYLYQIVLESQVFERIEVTDCFGIIVNSILIFILNLVSIYSLLLIFNMIINLFSFSQYISGIITLSKKEEELK